MASGKGLAGDASSLTNIPAANLTGSLPAGMGGKILQVVQTVYTANRTYSVTAHSWFEITELSTTITPSSTSSKILAMVNFGKIDISGNGWSHKFVRNSTDIGVGDLVGSRKQATFGANGYGVDANHVDALTFMYLDSPATTSSTTYKIYAAIENTTLYLNRTGSYTNSSDAIHSTGISNMILMEVAG
jgi:hypothetical protein